MKETKLIEMNVNKLLSNIPNDKLLHFFYGSIISFISVFFIGIYGLWITVIIAALKEILYDGLMNKGTVDFYDFVFTCIPCLMYLILL